MWQLQDAYGTFDFFPMFDLFIFQKIQKKVAWANFDSDRFLSFTSLYRGLMDKKGLDENVKKNVTK